MDSEKRIKGVFDLPMFVCRGEISRETYVDLFGWYRLLAEDNQKKCTVLVDSPGGEVESGLDMYNTIRLASIVYGVETTGVVTSVGCSASVFVLNGCDHRIGLAESRYMIHPVALYKPMDMKMFEKILEADPDFAEEAKDCLEGLKRDQSKVVRVFRDRTCLSAEAVLRSLVTDVWLTAYEAKDFGIINEVLAI